MATMINKAILQKELKTLPSEMGWVRMSDVMGIVEKQKSVIQESDVLLDSLKGLKEEYHSNEDFMVSGNTYSMDQMMEELRNDSGIGLEYRKNVNKMILTYMVNNPA